MKRPFEISEKIFPFESKFLEIEGMAVHYLDEGEGPVIVMCHGNPSWSLLYVPMIEKLKATHRCIAVDYPGFGFSQKTDCGDYRFYPEDHARILGTVLDQLKIEKFSIFVQDWGGPIGLDVAADRAEQVENLYIGNTFAWAADLNSEIGQGMKAFSEKMSSEKMQQKIRGKNFFVKLSMGQLTSGYKVRSPELVDDVKAAYENCQPDEASREGVATFPQRIIKSTDWLNQVEKKFDKLKDKPAILFWGLKDLVFPPAVADLWKGKLSNYRYVELPEAGHFFQQDEPDAIAAAIQNQS